MRSMAEVYTYQRRVEFRDTDMAGIVHFSVFFTYMEEAEHEMLRHIGTGVISENDGQKISFPRVSAHCDYRRAIKYDEIIAVQVSVNKIGNKSITYGFNFKRDDELVAEGIITTACCIWNKDAPPTPITVPDDYRQRLAPYLTESE